MKRAIEIKSENINGWRQMRIKVKSSLGTMNLTQYGNCFKSITRKKL